MVDTVEVGFNEVDFNEYIENHSSEKHVPIAIAHPMLPVFFGENWEEVLKADGAIMEDKETWKRHFVSNYQLSAAAQRLAEQEP